MLCLDKFFIPFKNGGGTVVDWDFQSIIHCFTWTKSGAGYALTHTPKPEQFNISMHRLLLGFPGKQVDHINHDRLMNTKNNLRIVTQRKNHHNRKYHGMWPIGVSYHKRIKKFVSTIKINSKTKHLGSFIDPISGHILYNYVLKEGLDEV